VNGNRSVAIDERRVKEITTKGTNVKKERSGASEKGAKEVSGNKRSKLGKQIRCAGNR